MQRRLLTIAAIDRFFGLQPCECFTSPNHQMALVVKDGLINVYGDVLGHVSNPSQTGDRDAERGAVFNNSMLFQAIDETSQRVQLKPIAACLPLLLFV